MRPRLELDGEFMRIHENSCMQKKAMNSWELDREFMRIMQKKANLKNLDGRCHDIDPAASRAMDGLRVSCQGLPPCHLAPHQALHFVASAAALNNDVNEVQRLGKVGRCPSHTLATFFRHVPPSNSTCHDPNSSKLILSDPFYQCFPYFCFLRFAV